MGAMAEAIEGPATGRNVRDAWVEQLTDWYRATYPELLRFAFYVTGERASAEDATQEAFIRLYRTRKRLGANELTRYARTIILNLYRSAYRRARVERRLGHRAASPASLPAPEPDGDMWHAVLSLSPRQRAVVALKFYEDMKEREIAEALGMSIGSVKKHSDRAIAKLREQHDGSERL